MVLASSAHTHTLPSLPFRGCSFQNMTRSLCKKLCRRRGNDRSALLDSTLESIPMLTAGQPFFIAQPNVSVPHYELGSHPALIPIRDGSPHPLISRTLPGPPLAPSPLADATAASAEILRGSQTSLSPPHPDPGKLASRSHPPLRQVVAAPCPSLDATTPHPTGKTSPTELPPSALPPTIHPANSSSPYRYPPIAALGSRPPAAITLCIGPSLRILWLPKSYHRSQAHPPLPYRTGR